MNPSSESGPNANSESSLGNGNGRNGTIKKLVLRVILPIVLIVGGWYGYKYYLFSSTHESTDDAYVTDHIYNIAPQVSGYVKSVLVKDNQVIKKGQLLILIDDRPFRAVVAQAKANLAMAISTANSAGIQVSYTQSTGSAQIMQAQGGVEVSDSAIAAANAGVMQARAGITGARADLLGAEANVAGAKSQIATAQANLAQAQQMEDANAAATSASEAAVKTAEAVLQSDAAQLLQSKRNNHRIQTLYAQEAVSQQDSDNAQTAYDTAKAAYLSQQEQIQQAKANVIQRKAQEAAATKQIEAARAAVAQAEAGLTYAERKAASVRAALKQSQAAFIAAKQAKQQQVAHQVQALGVLNQADALPKQISMLQAQRQHALANIKQAEAALRTAEINLAWTRITAPCDGIVSEKTVTVGEAVLPSQPLLALVPTDLPWIAANFKETQLTHMYSGQKATTTIDALPGRVFNGYLQSIAGGTGAVFALLPPDNATGNFTKVVQRIPVKVVLYPNQKDENRIRVGMSAVVTINTKQR
ncbi:MAG: HlyD family secretion protein [Armatimonadetes bacterium]|nr:HlyD family secretion protein [Armatimonadota bacterium]